MKAMSAHSLAMQFHRDNRAPSLLPLEWEEDMEERKGEMMGCGKMVVEIREEEGSSGTRKGSKEGTRGKNRMDVARQL